MERIEVEAFATPTNAWIIRTPGRAFPAAVVQGDSLAALFRLAQSVVERLQGISSQDPEALANATELRDILLGRLRQYEDVLAAHRLTLPYERGPLPTTE